MRQPNGVPAPPSARWIWPTAEGVISVLAVLWLATGRIWALLLWEASSVLYLIAGAVVVWRGSSERSGSTNDARSAARWAWITPLFASAAGFTSAISALIARGSQATSAGSEVVLAAAASLGVVVSWIMLHVGFATIYQTRDESDPTTDGLIFPSQDSTAFVNYLYFSFTVGTSFATSDTEVATLPMRRIVLIHSVVSFFYNALVVATALQVLQQIIAA